MRPLCGRKEGDGLKLISFPDAGSGGFGDFVAIFRYRPGETNCRAIARLATRKPKRMVARSKDGQAKSVGALTARSPRVSSVFDCRRKKREGSSPSAKTLCNLGSHDRGE
jgi:hypothetical protein